MISGGRFLPGAAAIVLFGLASLATGWVEQVRPSSESRIGRTVLVVNSRDAGRGSLREAIFAAAQSNERTRIVFRTARVELETPLPPIVNPGGVELDGETSGCVINGTNGGAVVLDLVADGSRIRGITLRNAPEVGLLVRARGVEIDGLVVEDCGEGVRFAEGAASAVVRGSTFSANAVGVAVAPTVSRITIEDNEFFRNDRAGIWMVSPEPPVGNREAGLTIARNRFEGDRLGVVSIHSAARIERNTFVDAVEAAIYVQGAGSEIRHNSVAGGVTGVFLDEASGVAVEDNELQGTLAGALVRGGDNSRFKGNRFHRNAYGIATVYGDGDQPNVLLDNVILSNRIDGIAVIGGSPLIRGNRVLENERAGVRILDLIEIDGNRLPADPRLEGNILGGNLEDQPVRGEYRVDLSAGSQ